jgi:hypothetical protein
MVSAFFSHADDASNLPSDVSINLSSDPSINLPSDRPATERELTETEKSNFFGDIAKKMTPEQVLALLGAPSKISSGQSGKQWIPFYFGSDTKRVYWSYKGIGFVVFSENSYRGILAVVDTRYEAKAP